MAGRAEGVLSLATVQLLLGRPSDALATLDSHNWSDSRWDSSPILRAVALIDLDRVNEGAELRIGRGTELRTIHRSRQVSIAELDAREYVQAELDRLNAAVAGRGQGSRGRAVRKQPVRRASRERSQTAS